MVGLVIGIVVWQLFSVFELKYKHYSNITQIHHLENIFSLFSFIEFCTQQYKNIFSLTSAQNPSLQRPYFLSLSLTMLAHLALVTASGGAPTRGRVARTSATATAIACQNISGDPLGLRRDEPCFSLSPP